MSSGHIGMRLTKRTETTKPSALRIPRALPNFSVIFVVCQLSRSTTRPSKTPSTVHQSKRQAVNCQKRSGISMRAPYVWLLEDKQMTAEAAKGWNTITNYPNDQKTKKKRMNFFCSLRGKVIERSIHSDGGTHLILRALKNRIINDDQRWATNDNESAIRIRDSSSEHTIEKNSRNAAVRHSKKTEMKWNFAEKCSFSKIQNDRFDE